MSPPLPSNRTRCRIVRPVRFFAGREFSFMAGGADEQSVVVLDFETSGLSPLQGDRAIEIGAVLVAGGRIVDRFQSLMNPGLRISRFIEDYTGISNAMLEQAPPAEQVMEHFAGFIGLHPLIAHNASFDRRFLDAELARIGRRRGQEFACSMLLSRRIYPEAPNHRLETLVRFKGLGGDGLFHRALADAEKTAQLWLRMAADLREEYGFRRVSFGLLGTLAGMKKHQARAFLRQAAEQAGKSLPD